MHISKKIETRDKKGWTPLSYHFPIVFHSAGQVWQVEAELGGALGHALLHDEVDQIQSSSHLTENRILAKINQSLFKIHGRIEDEHFEETKVNYFKLVCNNHPRDP